MTVQAFRVTETIEHAHPFHCGYKLYPGDLLVSENGGTWMKAAPGLAIGGFRLTDEEEATLEAVTFERLGLLYRVIEPGATS